MLVAAALSVEALAGPGGRLELPELGTVWRLLHAGGTR